MLSDLSAALTTQDATMPQRRAGILAAVRLGVDDAHHEGLDRRVSLIAKRA